MNIRLIALDMDGTTLRNDHHVSAHTLSTLKKVIQHGITVVPASGRMADILPPELLTLEGIRYIIASNGANIIDLSAQKVIYSDHLPAPTLQAVFEVLRPFHLYSELYSCNKIYVEKRFFNAFLESRHSYPPAFLDHIFEVEDLYSYALEHDLPVEKVNLPFLDPSLVLPLGNAIRALKGITLTTSGFDNLEINASDVSKAHALAALARHLSIPRESIMAIGDNYNDIEMIRWAGLGVAVSNAIRSLKEAADAVTASNEEDGVAQAVEKFIFKNKT